MSQKYFGMSGMSGKEFSYYHLSLTTLSLVTETFLEEETEINRKLIWATSWQEDVLENPRISCLYEEQSMSC